MRRRLALSSSILAILLVLVLPATTFASSFTYTVQTNQCDASGGNNGYGFIKLEVQLKESGWSGANAFSWDAKFQHREVGSTRWYNADSWSRDWYTFPNDGRSFSYSFWYSYHPDDFAWHRIVIKLRVWHNNSVLASRTIKGDYC